MKKEKRTLNKSLLIRLKENEKQCLDNYLCKNELKAQDLLRDYILQLISNQNTELYNSKDI